MIQPVSMPQERPRISAVTGTNGKTSVATATRQLMKLAGWEAAGYDSTGVTDADGALHPSDIRRSPDYLPELIDAMVADGVEAVSLEAFVGILADGLFERVEVDVAVCTGLERDHIDVHGSVEAYWNAKLRLFREYLRPDGVAILATDCLRGDLVRAAAAERGIRVVEVGTGGDVRLEDTENRSGRLHGTLVIDEDRHPVVLPTVHTIAVTNLLLATTVVIALGGDPTRVTEALGSVEPPPGRLQVIAERDGVTAMVDTAHNPGALRTALHAVRPTTEGRLILVFGAGGERDRGKRREMGEIAGELADLVILTDDNPRREPPARIRTEVRAGCPECLEIPRRPEAIIAAVLMARPGDTILVAGKGDETEQIVARGRIPHDDRVALHRAMFPIT
jgi:UDP-N-acetylmuramoyl-L-alanyl-D-glutamate--2,6-diaminopimelate ligase